MINTIMEKGYLFEINRRTGVQEPFQYFVMRSSIIPDHYVLNFMAKNLIPVVYPFIREKEVLQNHILDFMKHKSVKIRTGNYGDPKGYQGIYGHKIERIFGDWYSERSLFPKKEYPPYLGNHKISLKDIQMLGIPLPDYCEQEYLADASLWVGDKGCITPLHQDGLDNVVYQLKGRKKWVLIHPFYSRLLDITQPFPDKTPNLFTSATDVESILKNTKKVHKFYKKFNVAEIIINEGEAMFLPAGWFHYVETVSDSITINFWADSKLTKPLFLK